MRAITFCIAGLLAFGCTAANGQDDELLGLWASETSFTPALQGELTLQRAGHLNDLQVSNGGQLVIVVPEAERVVGITAGNHLQGGIWNRWPADIVGKEIIGEAAR